MKTFRDARLRKRIVANLVESKKPKRVIAQYEPEKEPSAVEEATEHAKAYWLMGWTWEEIEAVLEDMGVPDKAISSAIKKTQEYAYECLKDGPFNIFKDGQIIALKNGSHGELEGIYPKHLTIVMHDGSVVKVGKDMIDMEKSTKLVDAFSLRETAKKLYKEADDLALAPVNDEKSIDTPMKEEFHLKMTPKMQTPREWGERLPETFVDVQESTGEVEEIAKTILLLREQKAQADEDLAAARALSKEMNEQVKKLKGEEAELGKELAGILGSEAQASNEMQDILFRRFDGLLIGYQQIIEQREIPPGLVDKHEALVAILEEQVPAAFGEIMRALETWEATNKAIEETLKTEVTLSKPPKKMLGQNFWKKFKDWVSNMWQKIKGVNSSLYENAFPVLEEANIALEDFINSMEQYKYATKIKTALGTYLKK